MQKKSFGSFLTVVVPLWAMIAATSASAALNLTPQTVNLTATRIENGGKCLDVAAPLRVDRIIQKTCGTGLSQQWAFVSMGNNQYQIKSKNSGMCFDVGGASTANGAIIQQAPCIASYKHQRWTVHARAAGRYGIRSVDSGKCLDIVGSSTADGAGLEQRTCGERLKQSWKFMGGAATPTPTPTPTPVDTSGTTWGKPNAIIKVEELFSTPDYTQPNYNDRIDVMSGEDLTPITHYKNNTYFVWVDTNRRPQITKISDTGVSTTMPIDPGTDYKQVSNGHGRFSLGIDRDGYIHVAGDMQNFTSGGAVYAGYPARYQGINMMYWKSKSPESISAFDIAGKPDSEWQGKADSSTIPGTGWQHTRFFTDNNGVLYASGHVYAMINWMGIGSVGFGIYKYDTSTKRWTALGAEPPRWNTSDYVRDYVTYAKVAFWEQSGFNHGFFQGYLSNVKFDSQNRLHMAHSTNTDPNLSHNDRVVYAVSPDLGKNWTKANGTPITVQPVRGGNGSWQGDIVAMEDRDLHTRVVTDQYGKTGVSSPFTSFWVWDGSRWSANTELQSLFALIGSNASNGSLVFTTWGLKLLHMTGFGQPIYQYDVSGYDRIGAIDEYAMKKTGVIYCLAITKDARKQVVLRITAK